MIVLLSPAKSMDFSPAPIEAYTDPRALDQTEQLVEIMRGYSVDGLKKLMKLSDNLATLNHDRFESFELPQSREGKQAIFAFTGDTYKDIPLDAYDDEDVSYAQRHIRILSGLYGLLRPLDRIQPYRLEMGTRLKTERGKNLYSFWGDRITKALAADLAENDDDVIVNCASKEYFKSVDEDALDARVITPVFRDFSKGKYKIISFYAKRARGMMADYIVRERVEDVEGITRFNAAGYAYDPERSTETEPVFLRQAS